MKSKGILGLMSLVLLCMPVAASAQDWYGMATWNISFPVEDTKTFVDETSFRGFGLEFRKAVRPKTSMGFMVSWEVFHERRNDSIELENATITGSQDRYVNSFPIMVGLHRYLGSDGGTRPYFGISGGGFILIQTLRVGLAEVETDSWEWGIMPEVGFVVPVNRGSAFIANARYSWALTGEDLAGRDAALTYWGIRVGFVWEQY